MRRLLLRNDEAVEEEVRAEEVLAPRAGGDDHALRDELRPIRHDYRAVVAQQLRR